MTNFLTMFTSQNYSNENGKLPNSSKTKTKIKNKDNMATGQMDTN